MRGAAERGLDPAQNNRRSRVSLPGELGIDNRRAVRPESCPARGRIFIGRADFAGGGIVVYHGINVARAYAEKQPGLSETAEIIRPVPVRLGQYRHAQAQILKAAAYHGGGETGMVHIRVARNKHDINVIPAKFFHFRGGYW
jgi:hypothetical protein